MLELRPSSDELREQRAEYEHGRSDGYADGALDARWAPHRTHERMAELRDELRFAEGRLTRTHVLGFMRGYREACFIEGVRP